MTTPDDVCRARAYLSRVAEPANVAVWSFVTEVGPVDAAAAIRADRTPAAVSSATEARRHSCDPNSDLDAAARHGIRLVVPESDDWPHFAIGALERAGAARVREIAAGARPADSGEPVPPLALWVKGTGDLASLGARALGVVGARACTAYGERVASDLAFGVAQHDVIVVSGGAYGIDAAAHRGALAAGGQTVIVSAGGIDHPYPGGNRGLFARAADSGIVLSESPPGSAPQRQRFLSRNRLIAALSTGTVVVEAGRRSGAANTAAHCTTLGRPLLAVPGPITSAMSVGCHALLRRSRDPAVLAAGVDDVLESLGFLTAPHGADPAEQIPADSRQVAIDGLDTIARRVFEALPARAFATPQSLSLRAGVRVVDVVRSIPALILVGLAEECAGEYRAVRTKVVT